MFIRTNDNIYPVDFEFDDCYYVNANKYSLKIPRISGQIKIIESGDVKYYTGTWYMIIKSDKIRISKDLKELIDEIIYIQPEQKPKLMVGESAKYFLNDRDWLNSFKRKIKEGYKYYGAIWTNDEPILKSVTEIDNKGALKLL